MLKGPPLGRSPSRARSRPGCRRTESARTRGQVEPMFDGRRSSARHEPVGARRATSAMPGGCRPESRPPSPVPGGAALGTPHLILGPRIVPGKTVASRSFAGPKATRRTSCLRTEDTSGASDRRPSAAPHRAGNITAAGTASRRHGSVPSAGLCPTKSSTPVGADLDPAYPRRPRSMTADDPGSMARTEGLAIPTCRHASKKGF